MKRTPIALTAAAVLLLAAGCADSSGDASAASPGPTSASSSPTPAASVTGSGGATASAEPTADPIAPGFPVEVVPPMDGATVLATSFDQEGDLVTVSLTGRTTATPEEVVAWYAKAFEERGFHPLEGETVGKTVSKDFVRDGGEETANVSVVPGDGSSAFTVGANVLSSTVDGARE
ncbi:hypothetical protein BN1051_01145 [Arthrobacter saudimassiliensis]|uniref:Uncharacterized protein n=1 Tax=Arthrobacter saudimassiliensis TaxID=1461584 RepID=A0A078MQV5_9MICC|nr:hypothetical protein BN1051_01145 [Arthrobacter saudimassiliensis]